jgi:hypothetical protein
MNRWQITIQLLAFSGHKIDDDHRTHHFYVDADEMHDAFKFAKCFQEGIKRDPRVWEADITAIVKSEKP